jgi:glutathionylspermidine synthase
VAANRPVPSLAEYRRAREEFFVRRGAAWPGTLFDAFDILAPRALTSVEAQDIFDTAAGLARIYARAGELLRRLPDEALLEMGVPEYVLPVVRCAIPGMADCVIGRLDLVRTDAGYKLLEYNADVPGLLVEAFSINAQVCIDAGADDPNASHEHLLARALASAVRAGLRHLRKSEGEGNVLVTFSRRSRRGEGLAGYVCGLLTEFSAQYAALESLSSDLDGLYDPQGRRIDVLYRIFPLHFFRDGLFHRKEEILPQMGGVVFKLVERRRLALINPPFAFLLENKALQVLIWNLFEAGQYFGETERQLIERYMLPTHLDPPPNRDAYVMKPAYGAEGDSVRIMTEDGSVAHCAEGTTYTGQLMVYQKRVDAPAEEMMTEYGTRKLHMVTSCFLISGIPAGICIRAGEAITDESAWVLPVCLCDKRNGPGDS